MFPVLKSVLFLLLTAGGCNAQVEVLKKYVTICKKSSPDFNDCLAESIQTALPTLGTKGIPELGMPTLDPYAQDEYVVDYNKNQIRAKMTMKDITVKGLSQAKIKDVRTKLDEDRFHMEVEVQSAHVNVSGAYRGAGRYNTFKVDTQGTFTTDMKDLVYTWKLDGVTEKRDGETYVRVKSFYMRPDVARMTVHLTNIFPDNPELTRLTNQLINQNWRVFYHDLLPFAQSNWNKIGVKMANKIFLKVPYNQLFPEN